MEWVARQPLTPSLYDDRPAMAGDLAHHRPIVDRYPLPLSSPFRRVPCRRQTEELTAIIATQVDIADVGAERGHDVLDNGHADRFRIERAGQRLRQFLEPPRSLLAASALCDVAIRLEHVASTSVDNDLVPRLDNEAPPVFARVLRFDLGNALLLELAQQPLQLFAMRGKEQFVTEPANGLIGRVAVHALGAFVPIGNRSVPLPGEHGVVCLVQKPRLAP